MQHDEARIKSTLEEESKRIVESAEQEIALAATQARRSLRAFAADLAVDQAAKQLVLTAENDRQLIAEFVGDVLRGGSSGGGKNRWLPSSPATRKLFSTWPLPPNSIRLPWIRSSRISCHLGSKRGPARFLHQSCRAQSAKDRVSRRSEPEAESRRRAARCACRPHSQ